MQFYTFKKYLKNLILRVINFGFEDVNLYLQYFVFLGLYLSLLDPDAINKFPILNPRRKIQFFSFSCLILTFS